MNRRGFPLQAIKELPGYLKEKQSGKPRFEYDINRAAPLSAVGQDPAEDNHSSEENQDTPSSSDESNLLADNADLSLEKEGFSTGLNKSTETSERYCRAERCPKRSASSIWVTGSEDDLAYGEYYPHRREAFSANVNGKGIGRKILGFLNVLAPALPVPEAEDIRGRNISVPEMVMPSLSMDAGHSVSAWTSQQAALRASDRNRLLTTEISQPFHVNQYRQGVLKPSGLQSTLPSFHSPSYAKSAPAPPLHVGKVTLDPAHQEQPSPAISANSTVYYTPLSLREQIDASFHQVRQSSEAVHQEQSGAYPYHGQLSDIEEGNPWDKIESNECDTLVLRAVDPRPLDELEHLHIDDCRNKWG
jgi:hypothetical protein